MSIGTLLLLALIVILTYDIIVQIIKLYSKKINSETFEKMYAEYTKKNEGSKKDEKN